MSKYDRLNKINIGHNLTESFDFHDLCRTMLVRMIKRKHKKCEIYTEYNPVKPNETYPDIWVKIGKQNYVYELQKNYFQSWADEVIETYSTYDNLDVILINLNDVMTEWEDNLNVKNDDAVICLRESLKEYLI